VRRMGRVVGLVGIKVVPGGRAALAALALMAILAASLAAVSAPSAAVATGPSSWSRAVSGICADALLFEGSHEIGTRAGAVAVAGDIRASTERRLLRIRGLQAVPPQRRLADRWLQLERRLADVYASNFVGIYDAIAAATTEGLRAQLPPVLRRLLQEPDALSAATARLERRLFIPDCTGGARPSAPSWMASP
jgi:hypothetical protein